MTEFKVDDWVIYELRVGQIKEIRDSGSIAFSDGTVETFCRQPELFRKLTLRNKQIIESFDGWYNELRKIDGSQGFNYPAIYPYFCRHALDAIDGKDIAGCFLKVADFVRDAKHYKPVIDGVNLFRPHG